MRFQGSIAGGLVALALCVLPAASVAEHRVALLIDNSDHQEDSLKTPSRDFEKLAAALQQRGFRCRIATARDEKHFRDLVGNFADSTPTRGTALLYFSGRVQQGKHNGKPAVTLLGVKSSSNRGYPVERLLSDLSERGGSRVNLVLFDTPELPALQDELPPGCLLAGIDHAKFVKALPGSGDVLAGIVSAGDAVRSTLASDAAVEGEGSQAISPPDKFVLGKKAGDEWVNRIGMVFCWCPPGRYVKGSPPTEPGRFADEVQEEVVIEHGFWASKYELTLSNNLRGRGSHKSIARHKNHPLTMVNLDDARNMTQRSFSSAERKAGRLAEDWEYSLPTEDQWEYAARAGSTTAYHFGDDVSLLPQYGNFADKTLFDTKSVYSFHAHRTLDDGVAKLARVGQYKPNAWGLHDIHGNVSEWCLNQAIRGGSWTSTPETCRSAYRHFFGNRNEQNFIGYRIVIRKIPPKPEKKGK